MGDKSVRSQPPQTGSPQKLSPSTPPPPKKLPAPGKRKNLRLVLPQTPSPGTHHHANNPYTAGIRTAGVPTSAHPEMYSRKASEFMFSQLNGVRDFAMSGLGIGEKSTLWLYNKISTWSKKWFTHMFLSIVLVLYTVGGALLFEAIEGKFCNVFTIIPHEINILKKFKVQYKGTLQINF